SRGAPEHKQTARRSIRSFAEKPRMARSYELRRPAAPLFPARPSRLRPPPESNDRLLSTGDFLKKRGAPERGSQVTLETVPSYSRTAPPSRRACRSRQEQVSFQSEPRSFSILR